MKHLIFFDGDCPFCQHWVYNVFQLDRKKRVAAASLWGKTAQQELTGSLARLRTGDQIILVENYFSGEKVYWEGSRAIFRILSLVTVWGKTIGWIAYLPWSFDWAYRFIAHRRRKFHAKEMSIDPSRLLP